MSDWNNIFNNMKSHGDFAGRHKNEQDAYFDFFAGLEEPGLLGKFVAFAKQAKVQWQHAQQRHFVSSLIRVMFPNLSGKH
ncbi:hypothetical protein [Cognatishimia maritima]|uniref:Uncharacterized protein n=1 Tax=Cognatishimia maritima TaxID=870908 RepID=A0A1M5I3V0_9RHOB|nr:hypothetical protein [Cognatishimia maritima]SHG22966.1 hypothetical protein SAMN04488044_0182 [Cognatishimia maritima]